MRGPVLIIALCLSASTAVAAEQTPPAQTQTATAVVPTGQPAVVPTPPQRENFTYDPAGRRDPFLSLIAIGNQPRNQLARAEGKAGLSIMELSVRGVMLSRGSFVAMVQGPDGKTFLIHTGDKLADGVVKSVNAEGLVVVQDVNDPLSLVKQREVSKKLRSLEVKQ